MKPTREIYDWKVVYNEAGDCYVIEGRANNDTRFDPQDPWKEFANGNRIQTSMLLKIDYIERIAETANSIYKLLGRGV